MSGWPVNAAAFGTPREAFLGREDVRWHYFFNRHLRPGLQDHVAFQAAGKGLVQKTKTAGLNHLTQLFAVVVALDEQEIRRLFFLESAVPGQNQTILRARGANQTGAGQMLAIDYILAHYTQPFC